MRRTVVAVVAIVAAASFASLPGSLPGSLAVAQDYQLCVRLEAQLLDLDRMAPRGTTVNVYRHNSRIVEHQRNLAVARQQAERAGCGRRGGFLFFRPQRPASCAQHDARIGRLEESLQRSRAQSGGEQRVSMAADDGERRRILAMLGDNKCGPQYERYAPGYGRNPFGMFFRDYTRDPYMSDPYGTGRMTDFYGTYRTLCVRTCDGYYWPISFSTVQGHFDYDEQMCRTSCPNTDVQLYVHRNPGEGPEQAMSLSGVPMTQAPNAFRYRTEFVEGCTCEGGIRTAALGERVTVDLAATGGEAPDEYAAEAANARPALPAVVPIPRTRPGNELPVTGSIATLTGLEDFHTIPPPTAPPSTASATSAPGGQSIRIVGPGYTLYRSGDE